MKKPLVPARRDAIAKQVAEMIASTFAPQVFDDQEWEYDVEEALVLQWMIADLVLFCVASHALFLGVDAEKIRDRAIGIAKVLRAEMANEAAPKAFC
jgi:hypothetical protein